MRDLLSINPNMAEIPDGIGIFPLEISIYNEQDFITTKLVFDAAPYIGRRVNVIDRLMPFMSAAVGTWEDDMDQINTVLYLLQEDPAIIESFTEKYIK